MKVHLFGKADSHCIAAWTLQGIATDNVAEFGNDVWDIVQKNFFVDDCLFSVPNVEEVIGERTFPTDQVHFQRLEGLEGYTS